MGSTKDHFSTVRQRVGKLPLYYREGLGIQHIDVEAVTRRLVSSAGQAYKIPAHAGYISVERIIVNFQKRHQKKPLTTSFLILLILWIHLFTIALLITLRLL